LKGEPHVALHDNPPGVHVSTPLPERGGCERIGQLIRATYLSRLGVMVVT
jgi:hypothetical protein